MLNHLQDLSALADNTLLATMDIKSLYTSIPYKDSIETVKQILNKHNTDPYWISRCIECILKNNNFTYNDLHYIQKQGTAMGTKMVPKYVNIFMHQLETLLMSQPSGKPLQYLRYIDDIWMVWTHGKNTSLGFIDNGNRLHLPSNSLARLPMRQ